MFKLDLFTMSIFNYWLFVIMYIPDLYIKLLCIFSKRETEIYIYEMLTAIFWRKIWSVFSPPFSIRPGRIFKIVWRYKQEDIRISQSSRTSLGNIFLSHDHGAEIELK